MDLHAILGRAYRHPILDFIVGMVLMAACLIELDTDSAEPLRLAHALALLGLLHLARGAMPILLGEDEANERARQQKRELPPLTFKPPKALPPPLPNNILSMEQAKARRQRRRTQREADALSALAMPMAQPTQDAPTQRG